MKKRVLKVIIFSILIQLIISIGIISSNYVFAIDTFRVMFKDGQCVKAGETIEVPIIVDNINFSGTEKGVSAFTCNIEYNDNEFEVIPYENSEIVSITEEMSENVNFFYNKDIGKLVFQCKNENINKYTQIATIKFKAKQDLKSGYYSISIINIEGGNLESSVIIPNIVSNIYVIGKDSQAITIEEEKDAFGGTKETETQIKSAKLNITQNTEGTKVFIAPDEENGAVIGKIKLGEKDLEKEDGKYYFVSEPWNSYSIHIYGANDEFLGQKSFYTVGTTTKIEPEDSEEKQEELNKNDEPKQEESKQEEPIEEGKKDTEKVKTGDYILVAVIVLVVAVVGLVVVRKRRKA